jgi:hypothetical protein
VLDEVEITCVSHIPASASIAHPLHAEFGAVARSSSTALFDYSYNTETTPVLGMVDASLPGSYFGLLSITEGHGFEGR